MGFANAQPILRARCSLGEGEEVVITPNGKPTGVLIGFGSEDDSLCYQLENDPRFAAPRRARATELGGGTRRQDQGCQVISRYRSVLRHPPESLVAHKLPTQDSFRMLIHKCIKF